MKIFIVFSLAVMGVVLCLLIAKQVMTRSRRTLTIFSQGFRRYASHFGVMMTIMTLVITAASFASAQLAAPSSPLDSLKKIPVPEPDNLLDFVQNRSKAIQLGKSLFWDMQVGSDGFQSCASCHFHAGADNRSLNQINPGLNAGDISFQIGGKPNYQLQPGDYPFHKLADINNRNSSVISDANDVTSSQGVFNGKFNGLNANGVDNVTYNAPPDPSGFSIGNLNVRQVPGRNTPSMVNAVFNYRNFWDGRAQHFFNGRNPFGDRDPNALVAKATSLNTVAGVKISLNNSSLASQAVGPPLSSFEMSGDGRTFPDLGAKFAFNAMKLGRKLNLVVPLGKQLVASDDSVLGPVSLSPNRGLNQNYVPMIRAAFKPEWWNSPLIVKVDTNSNFVSAIAPPGRPLNADEFTVMEYNFPLYFGLAVQMYESTLVANDSPVDKYFDGNTNALNAQQKRGMDLFSSKAKCISCHSGAETTNASVRNVKNEPLERMIMGNGGVAVYDNGFYNIGVRPTTDDIGVGGKDPFGNPLSMTKLAQDKGLNTPVRNQPGASGPGTVQTGERIAVNGSFKAPSLRNIALTAPYFHNGGQLTLRNVVDFYNRGGDFHDQNIANLDPDIENLGLTDPEKDDLVAFLQALTDDRTKFEKAPFDHPELILPNGHSEPLTPSTTTSNVNAADQTFVLAAVGRNGGTAIDSSAFPRSNFLGGSASAPVPPATTSNVSAPIPPDCPPGTVGKSIPGGFICR